MDRDQVARQHILEIDKPQSINFKYTPIDTNAEYDIALIMVPCWGIVFPPYNIAKLTGNLRKNNFRVYVNDVNIKIYHAMLNTDKADAHDGDKQWYWIGQDNFDEYILPYAEEIFKKEAEIISNLKTNIIGFSVYDTNTYAVKWFVNYLKQYAPEKIIILGGPEIYYHIPNYSENVDYIFAGEAESSLVHFLKNNPNPTKLTNYELIGSWWGMPQNHEKTAKEDLSSLAWPAYEDYDFSLYQHANGISSEVSRGCVAKCSFCTETHFWRYRYRNPDDVIGEIQKQKELMPGLNRVWFIDSLVNGNIKQLKSIAEKLIKDNVNIHWNGYARCNSKMDIEYFRLLYNSGCDSLSFGVESGSNKVLEVMNKKITVDEVYKNIRDAASIGKYKDTNRFRLSSHVNWIVGYPKEYKIDQLHSLALLYNIRTYADGISPGGTAGVSDGAYLGRYPDDYNISTTTRIFNGWIDKQLKITRPHRFIRLLCTVTLLDLMKKYLPNNMMDNKQHRQELDNKWTLEYDHFRNLDYIDIDKCTEHWAHTNLDFLPEDDIPSIELVAQSKYSFWNNTLTNEWITFFYFLCIMFGDYKFTYKMSRLEIIEAFGTQIGIPYNMDIIAEVENNILKLDIQHSLVNDPSTIYSTYCQENFMSSKSHKPDEFCKTYFTIFDTKITHKLQI